MKKVSLVTLILPLVLLLSLKANAQTHRQANVQILNNSGKVLTYVKVSHKYSDVFKNLKDWTYIESGKRSSSMVVDYNTGPFTTGRDWWFVTWTTENGPNSALLHYTDPQNGRAFIDGFESVWKEVTPIMVAGVVGTTCFAAGCGPAAPFAAMAGAAVSSQVFGRMMNSESTAGYKQHILKSDDAGKITTIEIRADGSVVFISESGISTTGSTRTVMNNNGAVESTPAKSIAEPAKGRLNLAINAWGGAQLGTELKLHNGCAANNPDCTWTLRQDGMIVSDRNPGLAINAWNGARHGTVLRLHSACQPNNPDCTWTLTPEGMIVSDRDPNLAINAWGGASLGTTLRLHNGCSAGNPDCTWSVGSDGRILSDR